MAKRFQSCGLSAIASDSGVLIEYSPSLVSLARGTVNETTSPKSSTDLMQMVFVAIFEHMAKKEEFACYNFERFDLFHFRPVGGFVEEESGAAYEIFQMPLVETGRTMYTYIVIDRILGGNAYRLRGVSKPVPNAIPEYGWCNSDEYWLYWSDAPTDFNR
jgi:hypothetical protein